MKFKHESIEINAGLLIALTLVVVSIGGLVEIVPLFFINETVEQVKKADGRDAIRPYTPLESRGRAHCDLKVGERWIHVEADAVELVLEDVPKYIEHLRPS